MKIPSWVENIFARLFSGTVGNIGESKLVRVLQTLHDTNPESYALAIEGLNVFVEAITPIIEATETKIDDNLIDSLKDAVEKSSKDNEEGSEEPIKE